MDNKIIIAMLLIIIALLVVLGVMLINSANAKTDTKITVTSNSTLYDGDYFSISLNAVNGTPITNQTVKIGIIDAKGGENPQKVTTDAMGNGMLKLNGLSAGEYTFNVTYTGNDNFKSCNATQKLTISEKAQQSAGTGNSYVDRILNDPTCHVVKDPYSICPKHGVPYYQDSKCDWFVQPF